MFFICLSVQQIHVFVGVGYDDGSFCDVVAVGCKQAVYLCLHFDIYYFWFYLLTIYLYEGKY